MYQFSYVLASIRDRVMPLLKDHRTILEKASRAHIHSQSLGHEGVFKSNALSTAEFDPLESNKMMSWHFCQDVLLCLPSHPFSSLEQLDTALLCLSRDSSHAHQFLTFRFRHYRRHQAPLAYRAQGNISQYLIAILMHVIAFENASHQDTHRLTHHEITGNCKTRSLSSSSTRTSLTTQILNLPPQNTENEKNNPGSQIAQKLSKQPPPLLFLPFLRRV